MSSKNSSHLRTLSAGRESNSFNPSASVTSFKDTVFHSRLFNHSNLKNFFTSSNWFSKNLKSCRWPKRFNGFGVPGAITGGNIFDAADITPLLIFAICGFIDSAIGKIFSGNNFVSPSISFSFLVISFFTPADVSATNDLVTRVIASLFLILTFSPLINTLPFAKIPISSDLAFNTILSESKIICGSE